MAGPIKKNLFAASLRNVFKIMFNTTLPLNYTTNNSIFMTVSMKNGHNYHLKWMMVIKEDSVL